MTFLSSTPLGVGADIRDQPKVEHDVVIDEQPSPETVSDSESKLVPVPLSIKLISVAIVSLIGFGGHWSSGVTGAMKSTLKKELGINNTQYSLLTNSEDLMKIILILFTGILTDRMGGASALLWGNALFSVGSILIAAATTVRSFKFMIFGYVVESLGDVATQVAQYKVFSSWFPPSAGFASTLGFELGIGKIGSFIGKASANIIAKNTGDFAWVYWTAVFMNIFTNFATLAFWWFTKYCNKRYTGTDDPATGEKLTENNKKLEIKKSLELPWVFWTMILFTAFQTSTASIFSTNSTELAEKRFNIDAVTAGWYSAMSQYLGFFLVPCVGAFIDVFGNRVTIFAICGIGIFLSMVMVAWGENISGTAASFGIYAVASSLGPTVIIDGIRTCMLHQGVFGSAYAVKIAVNNSMNILLSIICGVIQDADNDSYDRVTIIYAADAAAAVVVVLLMIAMCFCSVDMRMLQWTRKQRITNGHLINERKERAMTGNGFKRNRNINVVFFSLVALLVVGSFAAYIWSAATGYSY